MDLNRTADLVLDTRTPPKVKLQQKQKEIIENSHAGIAEPVDVDSILLEETTKKTNFYKVEKPTTPSGLSTWILLSGQTSSPPPKTTKRFDNSSSLVLVTDAPHRIIKPMFKKRPTTTTKKPQTTTTVTTTASPANITKLNKIKVSVLNNAKKSTTTTTETSPTTILVKIETITETSTKNTTSFNETAEMNTIDSNNLPLEPKDGDAELTTATTTAKPKKTRRPTTKRKKNNNRKRRPSNKNSNSTDLSKPSKDSLGLTPMYNYLKKQVMPAVEAGLVGLMVTAGLGLAGYFLYPFGAARRNYDIDRKDKGSYYYSDDYYSGGIAEEEAIGKVIAGMQVDNYDNNYRKYQKNSYPNIQYKQPTVERINPSRNYNGNEKDFIEESKETSFSVDDGKQFVVGNMPKDIFPEVTPVTVPEHGPRKRRQADDVMENEIYSDELNLNNKTETSTATTTTSTTTTTERANATTTRRPYEVAPQKSFLALLSDLFQMKISLGLQILHNATESVARYLTRVQKRVDQHYKEHNRTYSCL